MTSISLSDPTCPERKQPIDPLRFRFLAIVLSLVVVVALAYVVVRVFPDQRLEWRGATWRIRLDGSLFQISLPGPGFGDADLSDLQRHPLLERIHAPRATITDAGVAALTAFTRLQELDLSGTRLTDEGVRTLSQIAALQQLRLDDCRYITPDALLHLAALPRLAKLAFNGVRTTPEQYLRLAEALPDVELEVNAAAVVPAGDRIEVSWVREGTPPDVSLSLPPTIAAADLAAIPHPEVVAEIRSQSLAPMTSDVYRELGRFPRLHSVHLRGGVDDDALQAIAALPSLTAIDLFYEHRFTDVGIEALRGHPQLRTVLLASPGVTGPGIDALATLSHCERLWLKFPNADPAAFKALAPLTDLRNLLIIHPRLTDEQLAFVENFRELEQLDIHGNRCTDGIIPVLMRLPNLIALDLRGGEVTEEGYAPLGEKIQAQRAERRARGIQ